MKCFPEETDLSPQRGSSQDIHALLKKATEKLDFLDQEQKGSNTGGWSSQPPPPRPHLMLLRREMKAREGMLDICYRQASYQKLQAAKENW